ncbi:MAG: hypothetical protein IKE55_00830 [Kiritimatiellae bacterium]|nr:hypothetical protein [Kiritimatiellia bacterium]
MKTLLAERHAAAAVAAACLGCVTAFGASVTFDAPGHVAVERTPVAARGGVPHAAWTLLDWRNRSTNVSGTFDSAGKAALPPLPSGYYRLVDAASQATGLRPLATLAVVPDPKTRPKVSGSFYGADCAASQLAVPGVIDCPWNDGKRRTVVADLAHLAGLTHVRDRMSWRAVQPSPGVAPDFAYYIDTARLFKKRGIGVSGIFHDTPKWAGLLKKLPGDLNALYRFCRTAAGAFGDTVEDWEFWNEPDIGFAPEPVWDYAAALKAAYLGAKAARPGSPVLGGALCQMPDSPYERALFTNDAARYFDVFNYHTYVAPSQYKAMFATMRESLRRAGAAGCPVWLTECGTNFEGPAAAESVRKGNKAHSYEQEIVVAEFCAKSQVALQMEGVARNYLFILAAYNERNGTKDWGLLRRDGTAKLAYAAMSAMTRELGDARLAGALRAGKGLRAYLFDHPDGSQTVAFWSESPVDSATSGSALVEASPDFARTVRLRLPSAGGAFRLSDLCGSVSSAVPDGEGTLALAATRFPAYVSGLRGLRAAEPARTMETGVSKAPDEDISVVFRVDLAPGDFETTKTLAVAKTDSPRLRVQAWNFGDAAKTGVVEAAGARLRGLPSGPVVLGPCGSAPVGFDCVLGPADSSSEAVLVLRGVFGGRRTTRLTMPVLFEKRFLASCVSVPLGWKDPAAWKRNDSAAEYSVRWDEKEQAVRFDVAWTDPGVGRWFYPVLPLSLPRESMKGVLRVAFEVKTAQDKVENDFGRRYLMLVRSGKGGSSGDWFSYAAPSGSWERRYVELPPVAAGDLSDVTAIRLGGNPNGMRLTFWVRDIAILKAKGE